MILTISPRRPRHRRIRRNASSTNIDNASTDNASIDIALDIKNPQELAALIDQARTETDVGKRTALYHQAVKRAYDQAYFVWLLNIKDIYGVSARINWPARVDAKIMVNEMKLK